MQRIEIHGSAMAKPSGWKVHPERLDGLYLLTLGCLTFVLMGCVLESLSSVAMTDFRVHYYSSRCLLESHDPYNPQNILSQYRASEKEALSASATDQMVISRYIYPPVVFGLMAPISLLPFSLGHFLWMVANAVCLIVGAFAAWDVAAPYAPTLSGALIGYMIGNSALILITGNIVGVAIGICAVAFWCFMKERYAALGIICLAISLLLKPHDSGIVWLCLLLAGGLYRKRALQALAAATILGVPGLVWASVVAPRWIGEMRANMSELSVHGGITDPGPASSGAHALAMQINLQTALSMFKDDPGFYNPVTYLICGAIFVVWAVRVLWLHPGAKTVCIALAVAAPLTMLPLYHRRDDAKLLLLAIPACAIVWKEHARISRLVFYVTALCVLVTGEAPWVILLIAFRHLRVPDTFWTREAEVAIQVLPVPLALLAMCCVYLWPLFRRNPAIGQGMARESWEVNRI
jgi:hypothetical protein